MKGTWRGRESTDSSNPEDTEIKVCDYPWVAEKTTRYSKCSVHITGPLAHQPQSEQPGIQNSRFPEQTACSHRFDTQKYRCVCGWQKEKVG